MVMLGSRTASWIWVSRFCLRSSSATRCSVLRRSFDTGLTRPMRPTSLPAGQLLDVIAGVSISIGIINTVEWQVAIEVSPPMKISDEVREPAGNTQDIQYLEGS